MDSDIEIRLLFPFLKHLKTDPVIVNYTVFQQACAVILCFFSFFITNICILKTMCFVRHDNVLFNAFCTNIERVFKEEIESQDDNESNGSKADENGNEFDEADKDDDEDDDDVEDESATTATDEGDIIDLSIPPS